MGPRESLNRYIDSCRLRGFVWGAHDCLTFTNGAFKAMYGTGWADDWLGEYAEDGKFIGRTKLKKKFKRNSIIPAIDERLQRIQFVPPLGALVASDLEKKFSIGLALGMSLGSKAVYLDENDIIFRSLDTVKYSWIFPNEA